MQTVDQSHVLARQFHDVGFGVVRHAIEAEVVEELRVRLAESLRGHTGATPPPLPVPETGTRAG